MAASIISGIVALFRAVPVLDSWFKSLMQAYFEMKLEEHDKNFVEAIRKIVLENDQRNLEHAIGSPNAGKPDQDNRDIRTRPNK